MYYIIGLPEVSEKFSQHINHIKRLISLTYAPRREIITIRDGYRILIYIYIYM